MPTTGHTMGTVEIFLIAMLIILTVPYLIWRCFKTEYYAPLVVVQIIGGILLGPGVLGAVFPDYYTFVFNPQVITALNGIAWWAVMIFVWIAGIELDLKKAWQYRSETSVTAGLALGTPLIFGCVAAVGIIMVSGTAGWIGPKGTTWQFVLGIGMACAVTALPILVLFMEKLGILREALGQRILRYASLDDIAIWGVLALILLDWDRVGRQAMYLVGFMAAAWLIRKLMRKVPERDRWYIGLIWLAANGFAADWSGLHFMVGAFLAGAVLDSDMFDQKQMDLFRNHILLAIMPVFFLSTGLRTNWEVGGFAVFAVAGVLLVASVAGKLAGVQIAGKMLGWQKGEASIIGWLLQTKALIMIIFVNILLDKGVITNEAFTATLLMAVGSTMLSIPLVTPKLEKMRSLIFKSAQADSAQSPPR
ncbi:cation:proton antiporter [Asticcacaulis sp. SL142]|uniref:cation:proton antiporter n=1 Tax=Asticcacaulis sp. SL142 TaxID=2995155 RepID=UPI00226CA8AE|nr:cation:proton antiporter [Asticcacaulis sp. SL142]WAC47954.1 cation:proton antiporter [Asticcacaulis sp. SL142]